MAPFCAARGRFGRAGHQKRNGKGFDMAATAVVRHVRMSPRKMRIVANMVRGKRVDEAMGTLKLMPKKAAYVIRKLLVSAVANAEHQGQEDVDALVIAKCVIDVGPTLKRWLPRAM